MSAKKDTAVSIAATGPGLAGVLDTAVTRMGD
jgi:hypothetical protein